MLTKLYEEEEEGIAHEIYVDIYIDAPEIEYSRQLYRNARLCCSWICREERPLLHL